MVDGLVSANPFDGHSTAVVSAHSPVYVHCDSDVPLRVFVPDRFKLEGIRLYICAIDITAILAVSL